MREAGSPCPRPPRCSRSSTPRGRRTARSAGGPHQGRPEGPLPGDGHDAALRPARPEPAAPGPHRLLRARRAARRPARSASATPSGPSDWIFPSYRMHSVALLKGVPLAHDLRPALGQRDATSCKGRQMPNHFTSARSTGSRSPPPSARRSPRPRARRAPRRSAATTWSPGPGSATAARRRTTSTPGMNFAGVWKAPVRLRLREQPLGDLGPAGEADGERDLRRRRRWPTACPASASTATTSWPSTRRRRRRASARSRATGPTLIETVTFRMGPHSSSDDPDALPGPRGLKEAWEKKDPIDRFRAYLKSQAHLDQGLGGGVHGGLPGRGRHGRRGGGVDAGARPSRRCSTTSTPRCPQASGGAAGRAARADPARAATSRTPGARSRSRHRPSDAPRRAGGRTAMPQMTMIQAINDALHVAMDEGRLRRRPRRGHRQEGRRVRRHRGPPRGVRRRCA